ncbi:MAG: DUF3422 domain-containing protein [Proteobacteria bacterium]|nr:DUF3422 domain-containing protein [Pseudomonadota bacterium]
MAIPSDHPRRRELAGEAHARPPDALDSPLRVSYLAILTGPGSDGRVEWAQLEALFARHGLASPGAPQNHCRADLHGLGVRYERHTEFYRYTFMRPGLGGDPFAETALDQLPADWLAGLRGETLVALHAVLLPWDPAADPDVLARRYFDGNGLIGGDIGDAGGRALSDFQLRTDGFMRLVVQDRDMSPRQSGRMLQRLLEIETYRMLALLALPAARDLAPFLARAEAEVAAVTTELATAAPRDEAPLLERLTRLEAAVGREEAASDYRFRAAFAYYELVQRRTLELRETRIPGSQTLGEFIDRRLAPAIATCRAVANRQDALSRRVARVNQLLATRIDLTRESQNQQLLESMDRRSAAQLRLQQTVEGLSVAAITYYVVALIGDVAKGLDEIGVAVRPEVVMAISIPVVGLLAALSIRHLRHAIVGRARDGGG